MSHHSTYLFIGGPEDGKRVVIPERERYCMALDRGTREQVSYRKECFRFGAGERPDFEIFIFIVNGMSEAEVMARLFERYPAPERKPNYPGRIT